MTTITKEDEAKEEERIMRSITRKRELQSGAAGGKSRPVSMIVQEPHNITINTAQHPPVPSLSSVTPRGTTTSQPPNNDDDSNSSTQTTSDIIARSVSTPSSATYVPRMSSPPQLIGASSVELEQLKDKKRNLLGSIVRVRRELEEVRTEITKLKQKENELLALIEKRESAIHQLTTQIEQMETHEHTDNQAIDEQKKKEKARKVKEENERRRKEEEEEKRRKELEDEKRKKSVVNSPNYVGNIEESHTTASAGDPFRPLPIEEDLEAEEARLLRAMSRQKPTQHRTSAYTKGSAQAAQQPITATATTAAKPEPHWKEQERIKEIERNQRIAEEHRKKEEAKAEQERHAKEEANHHSSSAQLHDQGESAAAGDGGGIMHTFYSPSVYTISEIFICGDFTDWKEVAVDTDGQPKNFQYPIELPVPKGVHFYRFKVNDKWEVNKNYPTGVNSNGDVMNKLEIS